MQRPRSAPVLTRGVPNVISAAAITSVKGKLFIRRLVSTLSALGGTGGTTGAI